MAAAGEMGQSLLIWILIRRQKEALLVRLLHNNFATVLLYTDMYCDSDHLV
jgi:hypothetical protein